MVCADAIVSDTLIAALNYGFMSVNPPTTLRCKNIAGLPLFLIKVDFPQIPQSGCP